MIGLIRADLRRLLGKKSFLLVLLITAVIAVITILVEKKDFYNGLVFAMNRRADVTGFIVLVVGITSFLGIYADEFSAKSFQAVIGRGIPRNKIVLVKLIDCTVMTGLVFFFFWALFCVFGLIRGVKMSADEVKILAVSCICAAYIVICTTPLAAVFMFATENKALSVFIELLLLVIIPMIFFFINDLPFVYNNRLTSYYITGFADGFYSDMMLFGGGLGRLLLGAVIYLGIAYVLTTLIFTKKELEL